MPGIDSIIRIGKVEMFHYALQLVRNEGIFAEISTRETLAAVAKTSRNTGKSNHHHI